MSEASSKPISSSTDSRVVQATGRRKTSVARVRLLPGNGEAKVNGRRFEQYFPTEDLQNHALESLRSVSRQKQFNLDIRTTGGGLNSQAGAVRHGIARALLRAEPDLRPVLKKAGFLTRDPRMKERKKSGQPGARRRFQFSKR
ncbi:MAG: 30S ribosomal protein S9 [Verrucomicrobiae bacterium]|nr:30S ribosomal protein S9 [Verrucomicrobiae bacterium]